MLRLHGDTLAALEAARQSEKRYALAVAGSNDGIWDWDVAADALYCSARWKLMIGLSTDDSVSTLDEWLNLADEEDRPGLQQAIQAHLTGERSHFEIEYRLRHVDGSFRWVHCRGIAVRDESGHAVRLAGSQTDITEQRRIRDSLAQAAQHDALTDLPNRTLFRELVQRAIAQTTRLGAPGYAVLFIDLDGFKVINDTHGHVAGDRFLKAIARRLHAQLRPGDVLARLGGDEFGVLAQNVETTEDVCGIAERLQQALAEPLPGQQAEGARRREHRDRRRHGRIAIGRCAASRRGHRDVSREGARAAAATSCSTRDARRRAEAPDLRDGASPRNRAQQSHGLLSADRPAAVVAHLRAGGARPMGARRRPHDAAVGLHRRRGRDRPDRPAHVSGARTGVPSGGGVAADVRPAAAICR